jgi:hypothetical protein
MENRESSKKKVAASASKSKSFLNVVSTCPSDTLLFKSLGLKPFKNIPTDRAHFVGEVNFENGSSVKIWVCPMPALFWKFEIFVAESNKIMTVSTGSGALRDFWNVVKLIADGMLDVESTECKR